MTKVLPATCVGQVVTVLPTVPLYQPSLPTPPLLPTLATPLPGAIVLSQGIGQSVGFVIIHEENVFYVANISLDLKLALDQVGLALTQAATALGNVSSALTLLDAKPTGGTGSAIVPVTVTDVTALGAAATSLAAANTALGVIKEALA